LPVDIELTELKTIAVGLINVISSRDPSGYPLSTGDDRVFPRISHVNHAIAVLTRVMSLENERFLKLIGTTSQIHDDIASHILVDVPDRPPCPLRS
jgi:hypothetical protein